MSNENSVKNTHSKVVLDYSFCNSSNLWNYLGLITIILFITTLISFLKYQKKLRHHQNNYNSIYIIILIILGLVFVVPCMCWLLTLVEILVTFIRYGHIAASPLPILSLPIQFLAFIYTKIISALHYYLTAPGTFVFLLFFMTLVCLKLVFLLAVGYGLPGFFLCSWFGFSMPLYAITEVGLVDSWIDLAFTSQLPILIIIKFLPLLLAVRSLILWIFLFIVFLVGYYIKFGLTFLFVCKCLLTIVLVRFTYVIGKGFVALVFLTSTATNSNRTGDDVQ
jgi:hypothetical protein